VVEQDREVSGHRKSVLVALTEPRVTPEVQPLTISNDPNRRIGGVVERMCHTKVA
jgi:hypothetical protein